MKNYLKNIAISILFALFIIIMTCLIIYPIVMLLTGGDDFDGTWLGVTIEGVQLAVVIFIGKMIYDKVSEK